MKKVFLLILFSTLSLIFLSLQGAVFNKSLAHFNISAKTLNVETKRKCSLNQLKNELPFQINTIVIDAGHGGKDPGCSGANSVEKHLALAIAKKFAAAVKVKYPGIEVILTRDKDIFIPLYERAAIANRAKADLFVSIHCNALPSSKATRGSETYVMGLHTAEHNLDVAKRENSAILLEEDYEQNYDYDPNSPEGHILLSMYQNAFLEQSIQFAERVEHHFHTTAQRRSRGVKQAGFVVLKETAMPSALVEVGFLTSAVDEAFLKTEKGQNLAASTLLNAFRDYKILVEDDSEIGSPIVNAPTPTYHEPIQTTPRGTNKEQQFDNSTIEYKTPVVPDVNRRISGASYQSNSNYNPPIPQTVIVHSEPIIHSPNGTLQSTISKPTPAQERAFEPKANNKNLSFSVQLAASPSPLDTKHAPWVTTDYLIEVIQENNLFKYQVKNLNTLDEAFETRLRLQAQGFSDAFIVSYQNGERITMERARILLGE